jgi:creatinine amidohydrolase
MPKRSFALTDLSWDEVRAHLETDRRLLLPSGACDQFGPHLPLAAATHLVEAVADELSTSHGILRAPTLCYGVNLASTNVYPGAASLRTKTLHRVLNELLASWEDQGFEEFILITANGYEPHLEALATVTLDHARVRVIDVFDVDQSAELEGPTLPEHGGEVLTSLLLHLRPDCVRTDRAADLQPPRGRRGRPARLTTAPQDGPGSIGFPTRATAEKGRRMYQHILEKIRRAVHAVEPGR